MISSQTIQEVKAIPIEQYLAYRGYNPISKSGYRLLYHSPLRTESTPSFWVNQSLNRFKDFGSSEKGDDVIQLVQRLDNCSFAMAVMELRQFVQQPAKPAFFLSGPNSLPASPNAIKSVKLLTNPHLIRYAESRRISYAVARKYCKEVYYSQGGKNLFALGFENDKGGYALRNGVGVKRNIGPAYYTTIPGKIDTVVNVFEGFFDFLSALEYYGLIAPNCTTIILNSTTNLEAALPALKRFSCINSYFDHDKAGELAFTMICSTEINIINKANIYNGYKDINEYWLHI